MYTPKPQTRPMHLRFEGESDEAFRHRVERFAPIARLLVDACLANRLIQRRIAAGELTTAACRRNPTVRIEFDQAIAFGGIGETLEATKHKHWGNGPWVMPLEPDDEFFADRITYLYRENSLYNRRYEQRMRLKELLGREHQKLVGEAKYFTKRDFLGRLSERQSRAIGRRLNIEPGIFWRACQGKVFLPLPPRTIQLQFEFID